MMARNIIILANDALRAKAMQYVRLAPPNSRVEFKGPQRSTDQNAKMWACLSDIARQLGWHGKKLTADNWKVMFLDALRRHHKEELLAVPNLDNTGFVDLGKSSSDLSKEEMADLITLILQFGDAHGVEFTEPEQRGAAVQE